MTTISYDEVIEIIRNYQYEQECIMDSCSSVSDFDYFAASKRWDAATALKRIFSNKQIEILRKELENE